MLAGGNSSEREVSLRSGQAVVDALQGASKASRWSGTVLPVTLDWDGCWSMPGGAMPELEALNSLGPNHIIFNALHGGRGENGQLQAVLETANVCYTGSGPASSALCMDKRATRGALTDEGLRVPPGLLVGSVSAEDSGHVRLQQALESLSPHGAGWFIKPNQGGSSAGITRALSSDDLLPAIISIMDSGDRALVEAAILGAEFSVGVVGIEGVDLRALPPVEIQPRNASWFDQDEKYKPDGASEVCPPEDLSPETDEELRQTAVRAHIATGCRGYSRTDFMVTTDGEIYTLEVNTLPGLTERSLLPLEAAAAGMNFESLCLEILRLASSYD